ncbi:acyl carrier protein [Paractinoplanes toevensis]|uniref:Actinorhodin polyketide synthase acyl carrier protein n=1 Tax=Paractinoplanes toevensis TaxID=571911 RepID=A0A919TD25_9ACTN|nr:acyl carrier protein [Actinoplanes toevensis]GIM92596.1 actinorhodin polyketide synthase acyl carrier protein [Actinoplanes toevensis]
MGEFKLDELLDLTRNHAGEPDDVDLDERIVDVMFEHLGYDSVALLEVLSQIRSSYGIDLSDDVMNRNRTPREVLDAVNAVIQRRGK